MTLTSVQFPLQANDLGVRFRRGWALRHCSFKLRESRITALVGPNGAGKSTLMAAAAGLLPATEGQVQVQGSAVTTRGIHPALGYLAQDKPMYRRFKVSEMLTLAAHLNPLWDEQLARRLIDEAGLPLTARVGTLSGGQRTRLALALVLARRPSVLVLDEPLADLDPLARFELQQTLLTEVMDTGMTVLLSSHIISEIQDSCDDLIILRDGGISLDGPVEDILTDHRVLIGPGAATEEDPLTWLSGAGIVEVRRHTRQATVLLNGAPPPLPPGWSDSPATLDEVVMAHLRIERNPTTTNGSGR